MLNLEVNGQKPSFIELLLTPLARNIKVSLKSYSSTECNGIIVLDSKTKEYCFNSEEQEAFSLFVSHLSEAINVQKKYLEAILFSNYASLYKKIVDESVCYSFTMDLVSGELTIHSPLKSNRKYLDASLGKIEINHSEI